MQSLRVWVEYNGKHFLLMWSLTLKAPIRTAADDKICEILAIFERNKE